MKKRTKKRIIIASAVCALIIALAVICIIYLNGYYNADELAVEAYLPKDALIELEDGSLALMPEGAQTGIVFYPGGRVDERAYIPLASLLYERGIACVIARMPGKLAVFTPNKAEKLLNELPNLEKWYVGGHSLGGSMACSYAFKNADRIEGVVLLASYSTKDLNDTGLRVLSVYGSEDGVLNMEKYESNKDNLPSDFTEHVIEGGNHAYFGAYGEQSGDKEAQITREEQLFKTAQYIIDFVLN